MQNALPPPCEQTLGEARREAMKARGRSLCWLTGLHLSGARIGKIPTRGMFLSEDSRKARRSRDLPFQLIS